MRGKGVAEEQGRLIEAHHREKTPATTTVISSEGKASWKNLPHKKQLLLLALCRLSTPLSNACLLPYLYYLVQSIISDPDHPSAPQEISRLTGLLVAAYPLGQMATSMLWGSVSDTYGRKPAILMGLMISVVANLAFGFSRSIGMLLFWRILAGMANGIVGVMRTMTPEIVKDRKYRSRAFLAPPVVFNSGRVVALAIGGCLADPVKNLPRLFGPSGLFNFSQSPQGVVWMVEYPYALPALFNGTILAMCLILAVLWLKETLPSKENDWDLGIVIGNAISNFLRKILGRKDSGYTALEIEEGNPIPISDSVVEQSSSGSSTPTYVAREDRPRFMDIWTRELAKTLLAFALQPLHNSTFLHIFPVFLSMPIVANTNPTVFRFTGGLGLAPPTVGLYLASFGICGILLQLFIYPRIHKRMGTIGVLRLANSIFPFAYLFAPYLSLLSDQPVAKWPAMAAILFTQVMARTMAIPSTVILLTEAAPRKNVMGAVHGAGNTVSAMASAGGPVIGGMMLAWGIGHESIGVVWWAWLFVIAVAALAWSFVLSRVDKEGDEEKGPLPADQ